MKQADRIIATQRELDALCRRLATADPIAFDTEFVSEHTFRPQLCLVQLGFDDELVAVDTLAVERLSPLWDALAHDGHETIVHAGRQELLFCYEAVGKPPARLFDVQLAAGMVGLEYPAGYGSLTARLLDVTPHKGETRTDWRRRPLSPRQVHYALEDVRHLRPLRDALRRRMVELDRAAWYETEMRAWEEDVIASLTRDRWRRVSGSSGLSSRSLAIVRELWQWREEEAQRRNCPVRHVLRDDLIVEMARRRSADPQQIAAIRGMERADFRRSIPVWSQLIERALSLPEDQLPRQVRGDAWPQLNMLGQFLNAALSSICRGAHIAPSLVGTVDDVRELVAYRLGKWRGGEGKLPLLAQGWRADLVGHLLEDLLAGRAAIRIHDPESDHPLVFEPYSAASGQRRQKGPGNA